MTHNVDGKLARFVLGLLIRRLHDETSRASSSNARQAS